MEADSKFMLSTVGGDPPDVVLIWTQATSEWAQSGLLQPLDPFMTPKEKDWFLKEPNPVVRKSGWYQGKLYGVVMGFDLWAAPRPPDHFRQAGLDPDRFPETLEELVAVLPNTFTASITTATSPAWDFCRPASRPSLPRSAEDF